ncbi:MAG: hypothetical protein R6W72_14350, partial [Desulfurivibrionaceae bacterium]
RAWLDAHGVAYRFHDFRADGLDEKRLISLDRYDVISTNGRNLNRVPLRLKNKISHMRSK